MLDRIVHSHETGIGKPDVRAFEPHAPAWTCVNSLFIDDVAVTVEAAQAAGMQARLLEDNVWTVIRIAAHQRAVPALSDTPRT
jgi:putative hydrolase of the HAD superfamily